MIFGMAELAGGHGPESPGNLNRDARGLLKAATLHQTDCGVGNRFGGQAMDLPRLQPEDVAGKIECPDLAPAI